MKEEEKKAVQNQPQSEPDSTGEAAEPNQEESTPVTEPSEAAAEPETPAPREESSEPAEPVPAEVSSAEEAPAQEPAPEAGEKQAEEKPEAPDAPQEEEATPNGEEKTGTGEAPAGETSPASDEPEKKESAPAESEQPAASAEAPAAEEKPAAEETAAEGEQPAESPAKTRKKSRLPLWARVLLGILCVVVVMAGLAVAYINGKLDLIHYDDGTVDSMGTIGADEDQDLDSTGLEHNDGEMIMPEGSPFEDDNVLNILLISTDERTEAVNDADAFTHLNELDGTRATTEFSEDARADSLILVSLNIEEDTIKLVSIERATGVPILLEGYEDEYDWITHTFRYGGARLTMDTVSECLNLDLDRYVRINFNSFVQIVDAVGGIDIELTETEAAALNWEIPSNSMLIVGKVHAGLNHLDGYTALQYARLRSIDNDWQRIVRQRTVIQAVLDQIQHASVSELDELLNTVLPLVQTNFTKSEIAALLVQLPGFLGVEADQMSLPVDGTYGVRTGMDNRTMYDPDWQTNSDILQDFLYEGMSAEDAIAAHVESEDAATAETALELTDKQEYLTRNSSPLDLEEGITVEDFGNGNYRVFLAGAPDNTAQTWQMKQGLVQYLHESQGVNVLMEDCGPAEAMAWQQYIDTGSIGNSEPLFDTEEEEEYWNWLADYNQDQLDSGKFTIVGLGTDDDPELALQGMLTLMDEEADPEELSCPLSRNLLANMQDSESLTEGARGRLYYSLRRLLNNGEEGMNDLNVIFGENAETAISILQASLSASDSTEGMNAAFENAWAQYGDQNFFGMFDPEQVLLTPADLDGDGEAPQTTLAMAVNTGSTPAAGKVCAILGVCLDVDGEGQQPGGDALDAEGLYQELTEADELAAELERLASGEELPESTATPEPEEEGEEEGPGNVYFLALDGSGSPYTEENGILINQTSEQPAADYFQKIILVPSADPDTPIERESGEAEAANW